MCQARKIAEAAPNLVELVEIPGGHCAILEHPEAVNGASAGAGRIGDRAAAHQLLRVAATSAAARCPERTAPSRKPVHSSAVSVPAQCSGPTGSRSSGPNSVHDPGGTAAVGPPGAKVSAPQQWSRYSIGFSASGPNSAAKPGERVAGGAARGRARRTPRESTKPEQDSRAVVAGADVEGDEDRPLVGQRLTGQVLVPPERPGVGGVGLAQGALRPALGQLLVADRRGRGDVDAQPVRRRDRQDRAASPRRHRPRTSPPPRRRTIRCGDTTALSRTRSPSSAAILSAICWVPPGKWSCWAPPTTSSMRSRPPAALT